MYPNSTGTRHVENCGENNSQTTNGRSMRLAAVIITINVIVIIIIIIIIIEVYSGADSRARRPVTETGQIHVKGGQSDTYSTH